MALDWQTLLLEEQVAQLFMVGYEGIRPNAITRRFLERGVGGLIFFRDNFEGLTPQSAQTAYDVIFGLTADVPAYLPRPLMGIDQEGGQVERLPHWMFPTALTPRAVALSAQPEALAKDMYGLMANRLRQLGLNLDFFPTLDVNLNPRNPIIGVRSFGDDPETIWRLSRIAMEEFHKAGLVSVGKHFPGHGNGTVDSHLDLPTLNFTEDELKPFQQAITAGLPVMLVAHGYYPALQTTEAEKKLPSSASPAIIQGLLRQRCGFEGVIITDDMCMGAITRHRSPVEAALAALKAGVDILLYKQSTEDEWAVYEAVLSAFRDGALPLERLHATLERIARLKNWLAEQSQPAFSESDFSLPFFTQQSDEIALRGVGVISGYDAFPPLKQDAPILVVHPLRQEMGNYAFDIPTSHELPTVLKESGLTNLESLCYPLKSQATTLDLMGKLKNTPETICFISFNPLLNPLQEALYKALKARYSNAKMILVSAGTPYDQEVLMNPDWHFSLCGYRPASMQALGAVLAQGLEKGIPDSSLARR